MARPPLVTLPLPFARRQRQPIQFFFRRRRARLKRRLARGQSAEFPFQIDPLRFPFSRLLNSSYSGRVLIASEKVAERLPHATEQIFQRRQIKKRLGLVE